MLSVPMEKRDFYETRVAESVVKYPTPDSELSKISDSDSST